MVKQDLADKLEKYVDAGGALITTFFSGIVDENEASFLQDWLSQLCFSRGIKPLVHSAPEAVETTLRSKDGQEYLFVLNHNADAVTVEMGDWSGVDLLTGRTMNGSKSELAGRDVWIVKLHS
ncbi:Beta-galactosidase C-terminal domain [Paenibacillus sp. PL91]|uniref:Beta-galactosidase C-terminal domain n=1 Tax=Paenibacillus sp. PL91 TaxID=2729538 RepID=UPI0021D534EB|nr:Beta-galactosidase C-terminal domain [Paenibacillus sp. PL91]